MNENSARLSWSGAGVRVPRRFTSPRVLRLAVERALGESSIQARASELSRWADQHDAGALASELVEELAQRPQRNAPSRAPGPARRAPNTIG
jgi:UDP:flavonoid glycosyltransferase YjiC (YdhE family)